MVLQSDRHLPVTPIQVLIVEDHALVAEALEGFLREDPAIAVVGRAGSVAEAAELARKRHPTVVLMDFRLPDGSGAQAAALIRDLVPRPAIVFLSGDDSEGALLQAVQTGACGFLPKSKTSAEVVAAVRRAAAGEMLIPASVLANLLARAHAHAKEDRARIELLDQLTPREREILRMLADGRSNQDIAETLSISLTTVRTHVQRVLEKLNAHSKLEAVALAARHRLLQPPGRAS
jgi:RNA polymerase sigma factor (sigma-70 family)